MNITDYQFIQSLNVTKLTLEQLGQLAHKLPNYTMVNYDSFREHLQQLDGNYPYSMPTPFLILITILGTLMIGARMTFSFIANTKIHQIISRPQLYFGIKRTLKKQK